MTEMQWKAFNRVVMEWGRLPDWQGYGSIGSTWYAVKYGALYIGIEENGYTHT